MHSNGNRLIMIVSGLVKVSACHQQKLLLSCTCLVGFLHCIAGLIRALDA